MKRFPFEGALLLLVAILCLGFQLRLPTVLPADADFTAVQQVLEAEAQSGDVVLLAPWWSEHARLFVPERVPVVGYQGSDQDPLELYPRVWLLSQPSLPKTQVPAMTGRTAVGNERTFGPLHLQLYANARYRQPRFSLTDALAQAQVYVEGPDGSRQPCGWDGRAHRCAGGNYVAVEWHEVRFAPRHCLRMFPPGGPAKLVVELGNVPGAEALALEGGFIWDRGYFHEEKFTPTLLRAEVNGVQVAEVEYPRGRFGWQRAEGAAVPAGATVRVTSQAQYPELRELCVEVYGFGVGAPP